jgi:hypothetical protein
MNNHYCPLQPCFVAQPGAVKLLDEDASPGQIVRALNTFYVDFLELSIRTNMDYANQMEINDGATNKASLSRVIA